MTTALADLYRDVILAHSKQPRNFRQLEAPAVAAEEYNPLCGDTVVVYVELAAGVVRAVAFQGQGCALSTAAASVMTEAVQGRSVPEVGEMCVAFGTFMETGRALPAAMPDSLSAFAGVRAFPSRVKCTLLPWRALEAALRLLDGPRVHHLS